jgi:hypothetical protein
MDKGQILKDMIIERMQEAEKLVAAINQMDAGHEKVACIFRWAIVGDEVQRLLQLAEETLSEPEADALRQQIGAELWDKYRYSDRRFKALTGKEIWEHFNNEPD